MDAGEEGERLGIVDGQLEPDGLIAPLRVPARDDRRVLRALSWIGDNLPRALFDSSLENLIAGFQACSDPSDPQGGPVSSSEGAKETKGFKEELSELLEELNLPEDDELLPPQDLPSSG